MPQRRPLGAVRRIHAIGGRIHSSRGRMSAFQRKPCCERRTAPKQWPRSASATRGAEGLARRWRRGHARRWRSRSCPVIRSTCSSRSSDSPLQPGASRDRRSHSFCPLPPTAGNYTSPIRPSVHDHDFLWIQLRHIPGVPLRFVAGRAGRFRRSKINRVEAGPPRLSRLESFLLADRVPAFCCRQSASRDGLDGGRSVGVYRKNLPAFSSPWPSSSKAIRRDRERARGDHSEPGQAL
jgi:hypothetical protein